MESLTDSLARFLKETCSGRTVWIACSGGLDSMVLLHLVAGNAVAASLKVRVLHVHHGLQPEADAWRLHCENAARVYALDFQSERLALPDNFSKDPENVLRRERYAVFARWMQPDDILLTAHHQDDQAETVLLQLLRGAGPKGLAAMPRLQPFADGWHGRPLLGFSRTEIQALALTHKLRWCEDPSNADPRYARNYLRQIVMPLLTARWRGVSGTLARVAENCADAESCLDEYAQSDLMKCVGSLPHTLSVSTCRQFSPVRQHALLRTWIVSRGFVLPSRRKLEQICKGVFHAGQDRFPLVKWGDAEIRRYRDDVFLLKSLPLHDVTQKHDWDGMTPLTIPALGTLHSRLSGPFQVRFRQGGERVGLTHRNMHLSLKKIFQDKGVPPWERAKIPLVYREDRLVSAVGVFDTIGCEGCFTFVP